MIVYLCLSDVSARNPLLFLIPRANVCLCSSNSGLQEGGAQAVREAEESFRLALTMARRQEAKSLELRAAMSLSQLWQQ